MTTREMLKLAYRNQRMAYGNFNPSLNAHYNDKSKFTDGLPQNIRNAAITMHVNSALSFDGTVTHTGKVTSRILKARQLNQQYHIPQWLRDRLEVFQAYKRVS